jgi:hypothetical protein
MPPTCRQLTSHTPFLSKHCGPDNARSSSTLLLTLVQQLKHAYLLTNVQIFTNDQETWKGTTHCSWPLDELLRRLDTLYALLGSRAIASAARPLLSLPTTSASAVSSCRNKQDTCHQNRHGNRTRVIKRDMGTGCQEAEAEYIAGVVIKLEKKCRRNDRCYRMTQLGPSSHSHSALGSCSVEREAF